MLTRFITQLALSVSMMLLSSTSLAAVNVDELVDELAQMAPQMNQDVLAKAVRALDCADHQGLHDARLAVIDYSRPSTEERLWVFDLAQKKLLFKELVAHGRGSGDTFSTEFSNTPGSHQSSIGLFRTQQSYTGRNGLSLRMQGLEPEFNHRAFDRAIVIHGADYVSESFIRRTGRIGRSHGCPAVPRQTAKPLIESLRAGHYVYSYYPDPDYLASSPLLNCPTQVALNTSP